MPIVRAQASIKKECVTIMISVTPHVNAMTCGSTMRRLYLRCVETILVSVYDRLSRQGGEFMDQVKDRQVYPHTARIGKNDTARGDEEDWCQARDCIQMGMW